MSEKVERILVEILQGTAPAGGCNCSGCSVSGSCGSATDWQAETEKLSEELTSKFGEKVKVDFVDVDKVGLANYPLMSRVLQMGYPYPVTVINGQPKFAGGIMTEDIITAISEILA